MAKSLRFLALATVIALATSFILSAGAVSGTVTVTTAGTRVQMVSQSTVCTQFTVIASAGNTNNVYIGGSNVTSSNGIPLAPGIYIGMVAMSNTPQYNLLDFWFDSDTNGNTARYLCVK